ncbi:MAG: cytidylate kinase-like family protein [Candidatus Acidiferrales bacterium]
MPIRIVTIEREYGSGGSLIAEKLANRLGWKLWDTALTDEIAKRAKVPREAAVRCDEHIDPLLYRLFKVFARGSYERRLPVADTGEFDTDHMVALLHRVIEDAAASGNGVIVGRGAPYILRNHPDVFHAFIFAPFEEKMRRVKTLGKSDAEARELLETIDKERGQFIKRYFGADWPHRPLYDVMVNSEMGDEYVIDMILHGVSFAEKRVGTTTASA